MVTFVNGNIFDSPAQVITNPINCVGVMGGGLASEFKARYPEMFADYKHRCANKEVRLGVPYLWESETHQILNFPTKDDWRNPSRLDSIEEGLRYLARHYNEMGIYTLALPALGCGLGGLGWSEVSDLIVQHLGDIEDLEVFVYGPAEAKTSKFPKRSPQDSDKDSTDDWAAQPET